MAVSWEGESWGAETETAEIAVNLQDAQVAERGMAIAVVALGLVGVVWVAFLVEERLAAGVAQGGVETTAEAVRALEASGSAVEVETALGGLVMAVGAAKALVVRGLAVEVVRDLCKDGEEAMEATMVCVGTVEAMAALEVEMVEDWVVWVGKAVEMEQHLEGKAANAVERVEMVVRAEEKVVKVAETARVAMVQVVVVETVLAMVVVTAVMERQEE